MPILDLPDVRYVVGFTIPPLHRWCPQHNHDTLELVWHARGRGVTTLADATIFDFSPGTLVWYPPHVRHSQRFSHLGPDHCVQLAIIGNPPAPFDHPGKLVIDDPRLARELTDLAGAQRDSSLARRALDLRAAALLSDIADRHTPVDTPDADAATRAMTIIRDRPHTVGGIDALARDIGLSADRLRHVFTARWGTPPVQALTEARIARAKELLRRTPLTLDAIANDCGYANARYFCTVFRKISGRTPGQWRNR